MKKAMVGVAVALVLVTSNAAADGIERRPAPVIAAPVPVYAPTWTGFYIGAGVGAGAVIHDVRDHYSTGGAEGSLFHFRGGDDGVLGTVIAGYDWQLGASTVVGVFADYDFFDFTARHRTFPDLGGFDFRHQADHNSAWSVGGRFGLLSSPFALWYVTAGYTQIQLRHRFDFNNFPGVGDFSDSHHRNLDGYFVGAGVDTRLAASNWFLRLEYRYSDYQSSALRFTVDDFEYRIRTDPRDHTARLTLTYKFSGCCGWGPKSWGP
jgi:outer membrane immunogenic protein